VQTYYYHIRYEIKQHETETLLLTSVKLIREDLPGIGVPKLLHMLAQKPELQGKCPGRDALYDLLRYHSLLQIHKPRRGPTTTDSRHRFKRYPNLVKELITIRPNELWVSDITYLYTPTGFCYLSLITDAYSHRILGYHVHHDLTTFGPATALRMALETLEPTIILPLIHHSDRGTQYASDAYITLLFTHPEIEVSMTEKSDPYENPVAERINGILKREFGMDKIFSTMKEMKQQACRSITNYNELRPHASCDYYTPNQAHQMCGVLPKRWKNWYKEKQTALLKSESEIYL